MIIAIINDSPINPYENKAASHQSHSISFFFGWVQIIHLKIVEETLGDDSPHPIPITVMRGHHSYGKYVKVYDNP